MPSWDYSIKNLDPDRTAIASGRDLRISYKAAYEICNFIRGMPLSKAQAYLEEVVKKKKPIPFKRYTGKAAHHGGMEGWAILRYPVKAAREILKLLKNVEANAEFKGLDTEKLKIIHIAAMKGPKMKKYIERAFGRSSPFFEQLTHIEVAVSEEE
ncbi:MAG: 50S ribosomal protein L22 [Candidatus Verstraetearchaeota archaeon]|nr:50S ribosomal protein L22 [Candidatus Verstraetearchaeota archaeon]RLE56986.1 MAG: 50S ribosomal protein L22 [Candidatus Verstraetearchaeota archaeon]